MKLQQRFRSKTNSVFTENVSKYMLVFCQKTTDAFIGVISYPYSTGDGTVSKTEKKLNLMISFGYVTVKNTPEHNLH